MRRSVGKYSRSKALDYEAIQEAKSRPDFVLTGGPLDKYFAQSNKRKHDGIKQKEMDMQNDKLHDYLDEVLERYHQHTKQLPGYALLGLTAHKGPILKKDVKNAYRRQSRKLHPDAGGSDEAFKELYAAYYRVLASVPKE